jgi:hypothetical protein
MMETRTGNELADRTLDEYETAVLLLCARALDGQITRRELEQGLYQTAVKYLGLLYTIGGGNLTSDKGRKWLDNEQKIHKRSAKKLAADVFNGRYNAQSD